MGLPGYYSSQWESKMPGLGSNKSSDFRWYLSSLEMLDVGMPPSANLSIPFPKTHWVCAGRLSTKVWQANPEQTKP